MEIDFTKIDFTKRPTFILRDMDGKALKTLTHALSPTGTFAYTNTSEINFSYPNQADGQVLEEYDLLTDMRILDVQGYGQFVLKNPKETDDGVSKIKECHFYSLEYEFTNKTITLEEGTYNFWNPLAPSGTIMGMILEEMPNWSIASISTKLIGKYRTFNIDNQNILDLMRSELQEKYGCIFSFDTYNRKIYVRSVDDDVAIKPVYLSTSNLLKEIEISYQTEDILTVLDVNGADGVDIRSVNPMGTNRIYNLDQYMNTDYFSTTIISKWNAWKRNYQSYQQTYYDLVIEQQMQMSRYQTELAALGTLNGEMQTLEKQRAVTIQAIANDSALQSDLNAINRQITSKQSEISSKSSTLSQIENSIQTLTSRLKAINTLTSFEAFFNSSELLTLDKYFRCGKLTDSSFVATEVDSYGTDAVTKLLSSAIFNLTNLTTLRNETHDGNMTFYTVRGGKIQQSGTEFNINADIVNGTLQVNNDRSFVFSLYLSSGTLNGTVFPSGTLSMTGTMITVTMPDSATLQFRVSNSTVYLTQAVTEFQKMSIEWELYEYGVECLNKLSLPTYSFSVNSANFFALEDFLAFAKQFELGEKVYLDMGENVISPIVVGVTLDFDDPITLELDFGDSFTLNNEPITFKDFLSQSISMGSSLDFNQFNYSNFVNSGAQTSVRSFMESAIDTMRNAILSGDHNEMTIDPTGLRMRKYDESTGNYDPRQVWATYNSIMFTSDNWQHAEIGIGEFVDKNLGSLFGIVAPALVGTILAGSQLVIESEKTDGGVVVFKVDAEGASLHNASFNLYGTSGGRIDLGATLGIVVGTDRNTMMSYNAKGNPTGVKTKNGRTITRISNLTSGDEPIPNLWADMFGDLWLRGRIYATDGIFNGTVYATAGEFTGKVTATSGSFTGIVKASDFMIGNGTTFTSILSTVNGQKYMSFDGRYLSNLNAGSITVGKIGASQIKTDELIVGNNIAMGSNAYISWSHVTDHQTLDNDVADAKRAGTTAKSIAEQIANGSYSGGTFISGKTLYSPTIYSNELNIYPPNGEDSGSFNFYAGTSRFRMLRIEYNFPGIASFSWQSGVMGYMHGTYIFDDSVTFSGNVSFTGNASGITATFG